MVQLAHIITYTNSCGIVMYLLEETIALSEGGYGGSNIPHFRYCGPSHSIANPFLTSHIQKIWTKTSQIQQKLCNLCILFVFNHDISHGVVISTIFAGRIEFSSDGKGIDSFFVLIIYMFQEPRNIFWITSARCVWPGGGGGGILCYQSPGPKP